MTTPERLRSLLNERILVLDGAMGTMVQSYRLGEAEYRGERFAEWPTDVKGNNDLLVLTQPEIIKAIHAAYLDAGADILETSTFNSNAVSMADYGMEELAYELNVEGARLARKVADAKTHENPAKPRFVAGVLGPTSRTCSLSPDVNNPGYRNVTFDELVENYTEATQGLIEGGADVIAFDDAPLKIEQANAAGIRTQNLAELDWTTIDALILAPGVPLTHPTPHWTVQRAHRENVEVIAGVNLPMLIRLEGARKAMGVRAAVAAAREAGRKYISVASEILGEAAA